MKILLADDSVTAQNMGKKILAEAGHEVLCVSNGAAALKKVAEQGPDLVILDIYMPGYSGLEVCERLKEASATAELPVVLTVGKLEPFRKEDAQRVRAEALIVKPFEASELTAAVGRFAEIQAAKSNKPGKSKGGKLGPQARSKPQWEDSSDDDFVTTSQKEMEKEANVSAEVERFSEPEPEPEFAAADEPRAEARPAEFSEPPAETREEGASTAADTSEAAWSQPAAEFSVQADESVSPGAAQAASEPPAMAKAAAAGAYSMQGGEDSVPEFPVGGASTEDFSAPSFPVGQAAEAVASLEASSMPADSSTEVRSELSAATVEPSLPAVDPAFEPDRTQWATQFATRYGLPEEEPSEERQPAAPDQNTSQPAAPDALSASEASTPQDEIAAILSNLPGGMAVSEETKSGSPAEASLAGGWVAEEVPLEDREGSVSLSEEMEQATRAVPASPEATPATIESEAAREAAGSAEIAPTTETPSLDAPAPEQPAAEPTTVEPAEAGPVESEVKPTQLEPDRVTGVMQSAAMAIATRATISAVTSQLHAQPAPESGVGPSSIEDLVNNVLERLKPKLIAEIKRELGSPEQK